MNATPEESPDMVLLETQRLGAAKKLQRARIVSKNWLTLKGRISSLWSDKTNYMAVGKPPGSPYDEVSTADTAAIEY